MGPRGPRALVVLGQLPGRTRPESCRWRRDAATLTLAAIARYSARSLRVAALALLSCAKGAPGVAPGRSCCDRQYAAPPTTPKAGEVERRWHVIDATDVVLGRLASQAATLLRGKHKPIFAPHVDAGDFVIIVNAGQIALTGKKRGERMR